MQLRLLRQRQRVVMTAQKGAQADVTPCAQKGTQKTYEKQEGNKTLCSAQKL
jgi:hypothetical protein